MAKPAISFALLCTRLGILAQSVPLDQFVQPDIKDCVYFLAINLYLFQTVLVSVQACLQIIYPLILQQFKVRPHCGNLKIFLQETFFICLGSQGAFNPMFVEFVNPNVVSTQTQLQPINPGSQVFTFGSRPTQRPGFFRPQIPSQSRPPLNPFASFFNLFQG